MNRQYLPKRKRWPIGFSFLQLLLAIVIFASCGEDYNSGNDNVDFNTGSHGFSLSWPVGVPILQGTSNTSRQVDCNATGIINIVARYYDINDKLLNDPPDKFSCNLHYAKIAGLPPGNNYRLLVTGEDSNGAILYQGEETGINIIGGSTTTSDEIPMTRFLPINFSAIAGNSEVTLSWDNVPSATSYNIYWGTNTGVSIITNDDSILNINTTSYTHTGLTNGTTYYYVVTAENNYIESGESEEIYAIPSWGVKLIGTPFDEYSYGISVDLNGNCYITGWTEGDLGTGNINLGGKDIFIAKYNINGDYDWIRLLGTTSDDSAWGGTAVDSNGNYYITGETQGDIEGPNQGSNDVFVSKYDLNGNKQWTKLFGTSASDSGYSIALDTNRNCYIAGGTTGNLPNDDGTVNAGGVDIFVAKFDTDGNELWTKLFGTPEGEWARGIAVDSNGNSFIAGGTEGDLGGNTNAGGLDIFITKYDTSGARLWTKLLGTAVNDSAYDGIAVDSTGNCYITGSTWGDLGGDTNAGESDIFVAKFDTDGNELWTILLGTAYGENSLGLALDSNDNFYITGWTAGDLDGIVNTGTEDIFVIKYDTDGNRQWTQLLGSLYNDTARSISVDSRGICYITGFSEGNLGSNTNAGGPKDSFIWMLVPSDI